MKLGEMVVTDRELRAAQTKAKKHLLSIELSNLLVDSSCDVVDIVLREEREEASVKYSFTLEDGFNDTNIIIWPFNESLEEIANRIAERVSYIKILREEYREYSNLNDHIQKHRKYNRSCKLFDMGYATNVQLTAELCGYLKLPNTTSYGCGGGDYEIKRTPKRVADFNNNIDTLCLFLSDCIAELRNMKVKEAK